MVNTFQPGDVVELKSGSPLMTVVKVSNEGQVWCTWYDFNKMEWARDILFHATTLKKES